MRDAVRLPDFLYIGAPKCASTWIFRVLQSHPQVFVPPAKDIFFFDRQYHRGMKWYRSLFAPAKPQHRRVGELSTSYLYSPIAARRISESLPAVRLMACIRNPIARAWSAYLFKKRNGMASGDFSATLREDPKIREWGLYSDPIACYREVFGPDRFRVFLYDDLQRDAVKFRRSICEFLDVDPEIDNAVESQKVLPASRPRSMGVAAWAKRGARLARKLGLVNLVGRVKSSSLVSAALYVPLDETSKERIPSGEWEEMAEYYRQDIERLSILLGRDLSRWLRPPVLAAADGCGDGEQSPRVQ